MCLSVKSCSRVEGGEGAWGSLGEDGGNGARGIWSAPDSQPSAQDAAALFGMVEAANHENKSSAVTLPAERHIFLLESRVFMTRNVKTTE